MADMGATGFLSGLVQGFAQTKERQQQQEQDKKEKQARLKLFEIQMDREQRALKADEARQSTLEQLRQKFSQTQTRGMEDPNTMGPPVPGQAAPDLATLLSDPSILLQMNQAGIDPDKFLPKAQPKAPAIALLEALKNDPALAEVDAARRRAGASQVNVGNQGMTPPPSGFFRPDPRKPGLQPEPGGPIDRETNQQRKEVATALDVYEQAKKGLMTGLEGTTTGPLLGGIPAFTSSQQTATTAIAAMAPALKQLFRSAGEGTFTDRDQALLLEMIPTRETLPEARDAAIQNIDNIVKAKLGMGPRASLPKGVPQGSTFVRDFNGKPVFRTPEGKLVVVE